MFILADNENREKEGNLVLAAEKVTPEAINFMITHGRGLVCLTLTPEKVDELRLPQMSVDNQSPFETAFTVSIEAREGVTTGISAADRSTTVLAAIRDGAGPRDIVVPGHIFPLRAKPGGVLQRTGQTEGSVDLARLAGLKPYGVICEIMNTDGSMSRMPDLEVFAAQHDLKIISVADLIAYRLKHEKLVSVAAETKLPTEYGLFDLAIYTNVVDGSEYVAMTVGDLSTDEPTLVRVHSQCLTGDTLGSFRCDCGEQLKAAMRMIQHEGRGVLLYVPQEGRGIGLANKIKAHALPDQGYDQVEAKRAVGSADELRAYGIGAPVVCDASAGRRCSITRNPTKIVGLEGYGLDVVERVPLIIPPRPENQRYMATKCAKMGHALPVCDEKR